MISNAEFYWWIVVGILCVLFVLALPLINNYYEHKETERTFNR